MSSAPSDTTGPDPIDVHVGHRLKQRRKQAGMSQTKLGEALGMSFQQVQKYERGKNRISASKLYQAARHLSVPIIYFFQGMPASTLRTIAQMTEENSPYLAESSQMTDFRDLVDAFDTIENAELRRHVIDFIKRTAADARRPEQGGGPEAQVAGSGCQNNSDLSASDRA